MDSGTRIGPYEVQEKLGAGGMGEVYLAQDTKLGRKVAIKMLPAALAQEPERLARFEQEAKALAALNHPNIAQVFGLETLDSAPVIAMEFVDGEDLSRRIEEGPLPLDEAVGIALQIASALGAAHEAGIVHRDLKPANVVVRADGAAKVLDFGLAKSAGGASGSVSGLTESPTLLSPAVTAAGVIMGTAAYMAPEQAKGRQVDRRADLWAFGCVLYEMLSGKRPFGGEDLADTMASVIRDEPDYDALPAETPASILRLLARCLKKNPAERLDSMTAVRLELEELGDPAPGHDVPPPPALRTGPLLVAAVAGVVLGAVAWSFLGPESGPGAIGSAAPVVRRTEIPLPGRQTINRGDGVALSHDGTMVAFAADRGEDARVYLRRLDSLELEEVPGSEGGKAPFFSPDDSYLAFLTMGGELRRVSLRGESRDVAVICDAPVGLAGAWDESGWIYFVYGETRLARVREDGGEPERLNGIEGVFSLHALPEGRGILLTQHDQNRPTIRKDAATIGVLSLDEHVFTPVMEGGHSPRYLGTGHLVFVRGDALFATAFDLDTLTVSGPEVSVHPGVSTDSIWAHARYDVSADGTMIYLPGGDNAVTVPTWVDLETGAEEPLPIPPDVYNNFDLSPDGTRLAIHHAGGARDQVYVYDARSESFSRLTVEGANVNPVWSIDGREVFFNSRRDENFYRLYRKQIDGSRPASRILSDEHAAPLGTNPRMQLNVTPDGEELLFAVWGPTTQGGDLWRARTDGSADAMPFVETPANEIIPQASPNGKWVAYGTDRAGPYGVAIRSLSATDSREWLISAAIDGFDPRWSPSGDAVYYRNANRLFRVEVGGDDDIDPGLVEVVYTGEFHDSAGSSYVLSADGTRVLINRPSTTNANALVLVTNWVSEVVRAVSAESD